MLAKLNALYFRFIYGDLKFFLTNFTFNASFIVLIELNSDIVNMFLFLTL